MNTIQNKIYNTIQNKIYNKIQKKIHNKMQNNLKQWNSKQNSKQYLQRNFKQKV